MMLSCDKTFVHTTMADWHKQAVSQGDCGRLSLEGHYFLTSTAAAVDVVTVT